MRREKRKNVVGEWNGDGEDGGIYRGVQALSTGSRRLRPASPAAVSILPIPIPLTDGTTSPILPIP